MAIFSPHDRLFHATFRNPRFVAAWLRHVLPEAIATAIDFDTLVPVGERAIGLRLRAHFADLVFHARLVGSDDPIHPPAFAALQPHVEFLVDDLVGQSETMLRRPGLPAQAQLTLLALANVPRFTEPELLAAIDRWGDLLRAIEAGDGAPTPDDALDAFAEYLLATTDVSFDALHMAFSKNLQHTDTSPMTTAQRLRREGLEQGLSQGLSQGQSLTLVRLLTRRFGELPPDRRQQVATASQTELDRWTDRLLDATSLPDVFAP